MVMHSSMVGHWCHYMMLLMVNVVFSLTMWMMNFMMALMMSMMIDMSRMMNLLMYAVVTSMMMVHWMDCAMMYSRHWSHGMVCLMVGMGFNMSRMVYFLVHTVMSSMMGLNCVDSTVMNWYRSYRVVTNHMMRRLRSVVKVMNHWRSSSPMVMNGWSWSSDNGWQRGSNSRAVMEGFRTVMMNWCQCGVNRGMSRLNRLMM